MGVLLAEEHRPAAQGLETVAWIPCWADMLAPEEHRPAAQGLETYVVLPIPRGELEQRNTAPRRRGWKHGKQYALGVCTQSRGTPPRGAGVGNPATTKVGLHALNQRNTAPRRRGWKHSERGISLVRVCCRGTPPRGAGVGNIWFPAAGTTSILPEEHRPAAQGLETG